MAWIILAVVAVLIIAAVAVYNNLVRCRKEVDNGWAQIDVQLKRRCDLIPNLVETVKGYAAHESGLLEKVTKARSAAMSPNLDTENRIAAETQLSGALKGLMIQVEAYPDLKANQNFLALQEELTSTENRISFARQHYNDTATNYNTAIAVFPACIFASIFNFKDAALWQITDPADREAPKVKF
ncbi:MAG: LemA family protein [Lentisphaerae bacterium]|nr:LemA family protein [Lentisphaerota bacterium]